MPTSLSPRIRTILILAAFIMTLSMGMRQTFGLFLQPIRADLGVSAGAFGFAMALQNLVWGISQPVIGALGDRFGARPVLIGSAAIYALGLIVMAFGGVVFGLDTGGGLMVGIGLAGTGFGVLIGVVSHVAPPERRTQLVGLVAAGGSLGTLAIAPLGQALIAAYGWQIALTAYAVIAVTMGVGAIALGGKPAATTPASQSSGGFAAALREAVSHRGYLAMTVAFFACGFQLAFITNHLPSYLAICGVSPAVSAGALGIIGLGNAVGTYLFGILGARYSPRKLLSLIYLLRTATIVAFIALPVGTVSTIAFATAMGLLWLGVIPLVSSLIRSLFGLRYFNTLFGVAFLSHQIGSFIGSWLGGLSYDLTASYATAWNAMIAIGLSAALLQWLMDDRARPDDEPGAQRAGAAA